MITVTRFDGEHKVAERDVCATPEDALRSVTEMTRRCVNGDQVIVETDGAPIETLFLKFLEQLHVQLV